jgi:hypothetical protein
LKAEADTYRLERRFSCRIAGFAAAAGPFDLGPDPECAFAQDREVRNNNGRRFLCRNTSLRGDPWQQD